MRACASRSPTSTTSACPTSGRRSSTRCSTRSADRLRARVRAVDRHGGRAARTRTCRSCRSRRQRPLCEFDVIGISLQYELTFTNVLTLLDLGGFPLRAADRAPDATPRARRRTDRLAPRADGAVHRRRVHRRGRGAAAVARARVGRDARARSPRGERTRTRCARRARERGSRSTCPRCTRPTVDEATGMTVVGAPLDPRVPARVSRAMVPDLDDVSVPERHAGAVRRGGVRARRRSRSRAAAPRAAGSARPG